VDLLHKFNFMMQKANLVFLRDNDALFQTYCINNNMTYYRIFADPLCSIEEIILNKSLIIPEGALIFCSERGHVFEKINFYNRDGSLLSSHFWDPVSEILLNII